MGGSNHAKVWQFWVIPLVRVHCLGWYYNEKNEDNRHDGWIFFVVATWQMATPSNKRLADVEMGNEQDVWFIGARDCDFAVCCFFCGFVSTSICLNLCPRILSFED